MENLQTRKEIRAQPRQVRCYAEPTITNPSQAGMTAVRTPTANRKYSNSTRQPNKPIALKFKQCVPINLELLMSSQLDSSLFSFIRVRRTSSLIHTCWGVRPTLLESDGLLSYTERCLDGWSKHTPLNLKSNEDNFNYFMGENERVYLIRASWGIYIELITSSLSCNDDCADCQRCHYCVD